MAGKSPCGFTRSRDSRAEVGRIGQREDLCIHTRNGKGYLSSNVKHKEKSSVTMSSPALNLKPEGLWNLVTFILHTLQQTHLPAALSSLRL